MFTQEFCNYISESIIIGNRIFSNDNRRFIFSEKNEKFEDLDFDDDSVFLEPLLLSHFLTEKKETTLEQLLYTNFKGRNIKVNSNENGSIYIPNLGSFKTNIKNTTFDFNKKNNGYEIKQNNTLVDFEFTPVLKVPDTNIEICQHKLPYFDALLQQLEGIEDKTLEVEKITKMHIDKTIKAFEVIQEQIPFYYDWLLQSIKKIQLFYNPKIWSFASVRYYGVSFISANEKRGILFFLEDIIHQSTHNIFNSVTYFNREELFNIPSNSTLDSNITNGDHRDIYGVFHGLFTQSCISIFFDICLEKNLFEGLEKHELKGRLSDNIKRWERIIKIFSESDMLSETGQSFFTEFKQVYTYISTKYANTINKYNTENQPYIFSFEKFLEANPVDSVEQ